MTSSFGVSQSAFSQRGVKSTILTPNGDVLNGRNPPFRRGGLRALNNMLMSRKVFKGRNPPFRRGGLRATKNLKHEQIRTRSQSAFSQRGVKSEKAHFRELFTLWSQSAFSQRGVKSPIIHNKKKL